MGWANSFRYSRLHMRSGFAPHPVVFPRKMGVTKLIQLPQNQPICYPLTILNSKSNKFRKSSTVLIKINFCTLTSVCSPRLCMTVIKHNALPQELELSVGKPPQL